MRGRGQTFTLEAFVASILLLATVAFALQAATISANTAGAADTELRRQHAGLAGGVLDQGAANGSLRATLLYWNETDERFHDADPDDGHYVARAPPTSFGDSLRAMFEDREVRYNVDLYFATAAGDRDRRRLVESGTPADNAVRVVETVTLSDDANLVSRNETRRNATLADVAADPDGRFYAPDVSPDGPLYAVVRVEVVLWDT